MVQDAVHVSAEPFQAAILGPDIWVAYGHQTFHCGLQVAKELPVLLPAEEHSKIYQIQQEELHNRNMVLHSLKGNTVQAETSGDSEASKGELKHFAHPCGLPHVVCGQQVVL